MNKFKKIVSVMLLVSLTLILPLSIMGAPPTYEQKWFTTGEKSGHDLQYGLNYIWVVCRESPGKIVRIDPTNINNYKTLTLNSGDNMPYSLAVTDTALWTVTGNSLLKIKPDLTGYTKYTLQYPGELQVTWDGRYLWLAYGGYPAYITRFDPETLEQIKIDLRPLSTVRDIVYDPVRNAMWAFTFHTVSKIDRNTLEVTSWPVAIPVGDGEVFAAYFDAVHDYLWAGGPDSPDPAYIVRIDPDSPGSQVAWNLQTYWPGAQWIHSITSDGTYIYAAVYGSTRIAVIDPQQGPIKSLDAFIFGHGLAVDPNGYLWNTYNHNPLVVDRTYIGTAPPPPPPPPPQVTISGWMKDQSGAGMPNKKVSFGSYTTYTDASGYYTLTMPVGTYTASLSPLDLGSSGNYRMNVTFSGP